MRRFEFVEGTSAKFWMADVEESTFIVIFGRLGTAGQRKEKAFPTPEAARKELEKKINEKLREGYHEVAADAAASAPEGAKGAAAAAPALQLPPRVKAREPQAPSVRAAVEALDALRGSLGKRSWVVTRAAKRARKALAGVAGANPASQPALGKALDALLARVVSPKSRERLPLSHAMELLYQLDTGAFSRALAEQWKDPPARHPAAAALAALGQQLSALEDPELSLRVGAVLVTPTWRRQWKALRPLLESYLVQRQSSLRKHLGAVPTAGDPALAARVGALQSG